MSPKSNRLIHEKSPYLLQHAHNPVDWHPWGEEAFRVAREQDKPLLVSIGYATCHWCHVMAHESFEDHATATLMNQTFINVKVDREERPDVDSVYMTACQLMSGRGGWPLNVMLTPEGKPFFSFTYLPRESGFGRVGMRELVPQVHQLWQEKRGDLLASADNVTRSLRQACREDLAPGEEPTPSSDIEEKSLLAGYNDLLQRFDAEHGGFGEAPKFPTPHVLLFLLRLAEKHPEQAPEALKMVDKTLTAMRLGGVFDQVGYGFHRYSTDAQWLLPHFEKMLYDQALLALAYTEGFRATGKEFHRAAAEQILTYVLRDLLSPEGAFFCAEDADSEGEEGKYYVFTLEEARQAMGDNADLAVEAFNCAPGGNFRDEASDQPTGANVLHFSDTIEDLAKRLGRDPNALAARVEQARQDLFKARERRPRPLLDDKILTDWNGLMIAALARGAQVLEKPRYLRDASRAADFILHTLRDAPLKDVSGGTRPLLHRFRDGEAAIPGMLPDYAFLIWGLLELHQAGGNKVYLQSALELCDLMLELFWDQERWGFFSTSEQTGERLICRPKEYYDGALPSGNGVAAHVLERLGELASRPDLGQRALELRRRVSHGVKSQPSAHAFMLFAAL